MARDLISVQHGRSKSDNSIDKNGRLAVNFNWGRAIIIIRLLFLKLLLVRSNTIVLRTLNNALL